jgi:hypothetical protein
MMRKTVSLDVSREGLIAHLGDQFVHTDTFIRELIQNARRAQASRVDINYDPESRTLEVADDGVGIASPEDLLVLGDSGFRKNVEQLAEERPFGMGFAAAIFAADFIKVATREFFFECSQDMLTTFGEVPVHDDLPGLFHQGTKITLTLSQLRAKVLHLTDGGDPVAVLADRLTKIVSGFPIPVYFNGVELERPHALSDAFERHGDLALKIKRGDGRGSDRLLYYQGLPLTESSDVIHPSRADVIVHLPNRFRVRTPDRASLVEEESQVVRDEITAAVNASWEGFLTAQKASIPADDFVEIWGGPCWKYTPSLLCDMPIPSSWVEKLREPPRHTRWSGDRYDCGGSRRPVPVGEVLASMSLEWLWDDGLEGSPRGLYAFLKGTPLLNHTLPEGHWAHSLLVDYDAIEPTVSIHGEISRADFDGKQVYDSDLVFCEYFMLDPGTGEQPIKVSSWPVWLPDERRLVIPRGAAMDTLGNALLQVSSYLDEYDVYLESDYSADVDEVCMMVKAAFAHDGDTTKMFERALSERLGQLCAVMGGQRFSVSINESGTPVVEAA